MADKTVMEKSKPIISWQSPDFVLQERDSTWYMKVGVIALVLVVIMIWEKMWTGLAVVIVGAAFVGFFTRKKPEKIECAIFDDGVVVNEKVFNFSEIKSFWLASGEIPKFYLQQKGRLAAQVVLPADGIEVEKIREILTRFLPEEPEQGEDLSDKINRFLKF